ncbi:Hypothetical_protein [Hexamita inflata]|uniref:Hypothetical_protein n=1 Tax=Hexamita inflata TaxID=28002 RepID=A0ABP1HPR9_9EUKA
MSFHSNLKLKSFSLKGSQNAINHIIYCGTLTLFPAEYKITSPIANQILHRIRGFLNILTQTKTTKERVKNKTHPNTASLDRWCSGSKILLFGAEVFQRLQIRSLYSTRLQRNQMQFCIFSNIQFEVNGIHVHKKKLNQVYKY